MNDVNRLTGQSEDAILKPEELLVLNKLRSLAAAGHDEIDADTIALAEKNLQWSLDDAESLKRAAYFMSGPVLSTRDGRD